MDCERRGTWLGQGWVVIKSVIESEDPRTEAILVCTLQYLLRLYEKLSKKYARVLEQRRSKLQINVQVCQSHTV